PRPRLLEHRARLGNGIRLAALILWHVAADLNPLELDDLLRRAILEDLELVLPQIEHRLAVRRGKHVDAHVVGLGAERRTLWWLILGRSRAGLQARRDQHGGGDPDQKACAIGHETPPRALASVSLHRL